MEAIISKNYQEFNVLALYRSLSFVDTSNFIKSLETYFLNKNIKNITIVGGDFIIDLINNIDLKVICFADDTVPLFDDNFIDKFYNKVNYGLALVKKWMDNKLSESNTKKSCYLHFSIKVIILDNSTYK